MYFFVVFAWMLISAMAASLTPDEGLAADLLPPCNCKYAKPPVNYTSAQVQKSFDKGIVLERPSRWVMDMQYRDIHTNGCKTRWGYPLTKSGDPSDTTSQEWILWDEKGKYCGCATPDVWVGLLVCD